MVTEGDTKLVRKWYRDFYVQPVTVRRSVSCDSVRHSAQELIITSYGVPRCPSSSTAMVGLP
jgi:site-specific DNA-adenine methylase